MEKVSNVRLPTLSLLVLWICTTHPENTVLSGQFSYGLQKNAACPKVRQ
jgi:hypothetical protein